MTHGVGGDMNTEQLCCLSKQLAEYGFNVLRFTCKPPNFKYRVKAFSTVLVCYNKNLYYIQVPVIILVYIYIFIYILIE